MDSSRKDATPALKQQSTKKVDVLLHFFDYCHYSGLLLLLLLLLLLRSLLPLLLLLRRPLLPLLLLLLLLLPLVPLPLLLLLLRLLLLLLLRILLFLLLPTILIYCSGRSCMRAHAGQLPPPEKMRQPRRNTN